MDLIIFTLLLFLINFGFNLNVALGKYDVSYAKYSSLAFVAYLFAYPFLNKSYTIGFMHFLLILLAIFIYWCACRVRIVVTDAISGNNLVDTEEV